MTDARWMGHRWARYLLSGFDGGPLTGISQRMRDPVPLDQLRAFWALVGAAVMAWWLSDPRRHGRRPYAWWRCTCRFPLRDGQTVAQLLAELGAASQAELLEQHGLLAPEETKTLTRRTEVTT